MKLLPVLLLLAGDGLDAAPLTEARAVELALQNSPLLKARAHEVDEARALTEVATQFSNPQLRVSRLRYDRLIDPALDRRTYGDHPFDHVSVGVRWSPPELGQRSARAAKGRAHEADVAMDLALAKRDLIARVRRLHATTLNLDAQIALGKETIEQRDKVRTLVRQRVEQHAATRIDQAAAEVDYLDTLTAQAELQVRRRQAYDELLAQLDLPPETTIHLFAPAGETCAPSSEGVALVERARKASPRQNLLEARLRASDAERSQRWLSLLPWPDFVQLSYVLAGDNDPSYFTFQLALPLPLLDWKGPDRRALSARRAGLLEDLHAEQRQAADRVRRALAEQAEQAELVQRYREVESAINESLSHVRKALESGETSNLVQVEQIQSRLLSTRRSYLRAQLECKLRQIEVDRLVGGGG